MRRHTAKRSRPKADIEPIRVSELLNGAGMRGFLSVLEPPVAVPHLREFAIDVPAFASPQLVQWLSTRSEALLRQLGGQQEALTAIAEVARRTNGGAERLSRLAQVIRSKTIHHAALSAACHCKGDVYMKKAAAARAPRNSAPEAGWQEWISRPLAGTADSAALHETIARLAYEHWLQRGCPTGSSEEDWFHAEKQLLQAADRA
jgi:hypothetical protein